jgi:hypothetical protein
MGFVVLAMLGGDTLRTLLGVLGSIAAGLVTVTNLFGGAKNMHTLEDDGQ